MLSEALGAPTRSHDATGTILVGGLLVLFSVLFPLIWLFSLAVSPIWLILAPLAVFPPLITLGYDLRVMEAGMRGTEATPPFLGWGQLVRDGIQSFVLGLVYLVPALVVLGVAGGILAGVETGELALSERAETAVLGVTTAFAGGFVLLYICVFLYIRPATLAVFAATGRVQAALSPQQVLRVALSREYAVGWAVAIIVLLIGWVIAAPLQLLIIGFFVAFYVRTVAYYAYGGGAKGVVPALTEVSLGAERLSPIDQESSGPSNVASEEPELAESTPKTSGWSDEHGVSLPWSPRLRPEAAATVQVGRGVSLSSDSRGAERRESEIDAGGGEPATPERPEEGSSGDKPEGDTESGRDQGDADSDHDEGDTDSDGDENRTPERPFEWERER